MNILNFRANNQHGGAEHEVQYLGPFGFPGCVVLAGVWGEEGLLADGAEGVPGCRSWRC